MRATLIVLIGVCCIGCRKSPSEAAAQAKAFIGGWEKLGKSLPSEPQISFFRSNLSESKKSLGEALENPSYVLRMWAAYVIGEIGPDARSLGSTLIERLQVEPNRGVRIYLLESLRKIHDDAPSTTMVLKQRFAALSDASEPEEHSKNRFDYLEADEKIHIAATICALDAGSDRVQYVNYLLDWLRDSASVEGMKRYYVWHRRREVVLLLEYASDIKMQAKPLLESILARRDVPESIYFDVENVLGITR